MSDDTADDKLRVIRELLLAAFTAENLRCFCLDDPRFRPICDHLGPGHGLNDMVDEIIDYCRTCSLWPKFLAAVKQARPETFARFEPRLGVSGLPAYTAPGSPEPSELLEPVLLAQIYDQIASLGSIRATKPVLNSS